MHEDIKVSFAKHFGHEPDAVYFSPGRVNLIGEHTDYNGGWVLPIAINLGNYFCVARNQQRSIRISSVGYPGEVHIRLADIATLAPRQHWQDYFVGVLHELPGSAEQHDGLDILIRSSMPAGGGLSSSASITMGFATLLNDFWELGKTAGQLASVAQRAENNYVGLACGVLDPFAVAMGKPGHAVALNCATMDWEHVPFPDKDYYVVAVNTGVHRQLADSDYNRRREECERALKLLRQDVEVHCLSDATLENLQAASHLKQDAVAARRAHHIVTENARVLAAIAALKAGDVVEFGRQLDDSHRSLRDDYEVSCKELDIMVDLARELPGVVGAKMTGGGFGGCIVAVVAKWAIDGFVTELGTRYKKASGMQAEFYVCSPAAGVASVPDDF